MFIGELVLAWTPTPPHRGYGGGAQNWGARRPAPARQAHNYAATLSSETHYPIRQITNHIQIRTENHVLPIHSESALMSVIVWLRKRGHPTSRTVMTWAASRRVLLKSSLIIIGDKKCLSQTQPSQRWVTKLTDELCKYSCLLRTLTRLWVPLRWFKSLNAAAG